MSTAPWLGKVSLVYYTFSGVQHNSSEYRIQVAKQIKFQVTLIYLIRVFVLRLVISLNEAKNEPLPLLCLLSR